MTTKTYSTIKGLGKRPFNVNETLQLLKRYGWKYLSWGVSKVAKLGNDNNEDNVLILKVNGHHFKGYVVITLDWDDTYNVDLVMTSGRIKKSFKDVYFDVLFETIDDEIERIEEYVD